MGSGVWRTAALPYVRTYVRTYCKVPDAFRKPHPEEFTTPPTTFSEPGVAGDLLGSQEQPWFGSGVSRATVFGSGVSRTYTYVRTYVRKPFWLKDICTALCRASASRGKPLHNYLKDICTGLCRASASRGKPSAIGQNDIPHLLFWKQKKGERKENTYVIEIRTYVRA